MKIAVFDVAADRGGALSVLRAAHRAALHASENSWAFIVSHPELEESAHLRVRRYPWVKRSWLNRVWFDLMVAPKIVKEEKPDVVVSLQNVTTARVHQRQVVYLHTALPFTSYRFSPSKNPKLWLYQKLVTRRVLSSVRKADKIIVQAPWMKSAVVDATGIEPDRVATIPPRVTSPNTGDRYRATDKNRRQFFYPAEPLPYKNHGLVFETAERLERADIDVEIACTISRGDLPRLGIDRVPSNIQLLGRIPFEEVQRRYRQSTLLFPSVLETVGLPLMEAQAWQTFILAADLPYAHDALAGYDNAAYFDPVDPDSAASLMTSVANCSMSYSNAPAPHTQQEVDAWEEFVQLVVNQ